MPAAGDEAGSITCPNLLLRRWHPPHPAKKREMALGLELRFIPRIGQRRDHHLPNRLAILPITIGIGIVEALRTMVRCLALFPALRPATSSEQDVATRNCTADLGDDQDAGTRQVLRKADEQAVAATRGEHVDGDGEELRVVSDGAEA